MEKGADKALEDGNIHYKDYQKLVNTIDLYSNRTQKIDSLQGPLENIWIYGHKGTNKTSYVIKKYPDYFEKDKSKYWNGYTN